MKNYANIGFRVIVKIAHGVGKYLHQGEGFKYP